MVIQAPPSTRPTRLIVIGPRDSPQRIAVVAEALRRHGYAVLAPDARGDHWIASMKVLLTAGGTGIVVVPRPDGSIGDWTFKDVHRAHAGDVHVAVVRPDGHLVALAESGLVLLPDGERSEKRWARFTWPA